jgi:hypothetical protein
MLAVQVRWQWPLLWGVLISGGLGCSGEATPSSGTSDPQSETVSDPDTDEPGKKPTTDHSHFACELADPQPVWDLEEVGSRLDAVLALGMPNPLEYEARYTQALFDHGDLDCPGGHGDGDDFFNLHCTTGEGYVFEGIALRSRRQVVDIGATLDLWSLSGDFSIGYPDTPEGSGFALKGAGGISSHGETRDEVLEWYLSWNGSWSDDTAGGWMAEGVSLLITAQGGVREDNRRHLVATGGMAIGQTDLYLDGVGWDEGSACLGKTTGSIEIRDPSGHWYAWSLGQDCDGCGELSFSGSEPLGDLCLDLSELERTAALLVPGKYTVVEPDTGPIPDTGSVR